ncbi:MAG: hypothetical protein MUO21_04295 [Nitrososphaeraceae archaeon]|nr:hypothetical protein [Nitrososphaeraceae archaeon]
MKNPYKIKYKQYISLLFAMNNHFNQVLCGNVFDNIIFNFISLEDAYRLSLVNSALYKRMNKNYFYNIIKNRIEHRLKIILGDNYIPFIKMMVKTNAVLSGSFIHQCVLNEKYDNTDIDIYVGSRKNDETMIKFFKSISAFSDVDYGEMYKKAFSCMENITNHYIDNNNLIPQEDKDYINEDRTHIYNYYYGEIAKRTNGILEKLKKDCVKFQLVWIKTIESYTLSDHIKNTGFDVCKNLMYYDKKLNAHLQMFNFKELLFKRTTFTIQNIDDFYYRVDKYSKRGFHFKPKYNKLLYLEYLYMHFSHVHILKTNFDEKIFNSLKGIKCGVNCPIKLLFRNVRHYHTILSHDRSKCCGDGGNGCYYGFCDDAKVTTVENDGTFARILPQLRDDGKKDRKDGLKSRTLLRNAIRSCKDIDEYAKIRNTFTQYPIHVYSRTKEYKYDIQYGLPCDYKKSVMKPKRDNFNKLNKTGDVKKGAGDVKKGAGDVKPKTDNIKPNKTDDTNDVKPKPNNMKMTYAEAVKSSKNNSEFILVKSKRDK